MLLTDIWHAFHEGKELTNPKLWKQRTQLLNKLVLFISLLLAIAKGFGYDFGLAEEDVQLLAGGVVGAVALYNHVMHTLTTTKLGLPPRNPPSDEAGVPGGEGTS